MGSLNTTVGQIDGFLGIRNTLRPERQPKNALKYAENVVILEDGSIESRPGYSKKLTLSGVTDSYQHKSLNYGLVVSNGNLLAISEGLGQKVVQTGLTDTQFSWSQVEDRVAYVGDTDAGIIVNGNYWIPLRFPESSPPNIYPGPGSMYPGKYGFRQILRHVETGMESAPSNPIWYELTSAGGFLVSSNNVPVGYEADIYVTPANDTGFQFLATANTTCIYDCSALNLKNTLELSQEYTSPMPYDVKAIAFQDSSLYIGIYDQYTNTSIINCSEPFFYHLFKLDEDGFAVNGKVVQMMGTKFGLLVATTVGIWMYSKDSDLVQLVSYGVTPGKPICRDQENNITIWTTRGLAVIAPAQDGSVFQNIHEKKLSVSPGLSCASSIVDIHGTRYSLVLTDTGGTPYNQY